MLLIATHLVNMLERPGPEGPALLSDISAGVPTREQPKSVQPLFGIKTSGCESSLSVVASIEVAAF